MVPLLVPNISPWPVFVTEEDEELGILVVGCQQFRTLQTISYKWHLVSSTFSVTCLIPPCHHENRPTLHFQCKLQGWPVEANWPCPNSGRADPFAPILQIKDFSLSSVSGNLPTEKDCQLDQKWKTIQYFLSCSLEYLREAVHYRKVTKLWTFFVAFGGVFPHYKGDSNMIMIINDMNQRLTTKLTQTTVQFFHSIRKWLTEQLTDQPFDFWQNGSEWVEKGKDETMC